MCQQGGENHFPFVHDSESHLYLHLKLADFAIFTYELAVNDPKGNPVKDHGKYIVVWKKQADGSWKAVADILGLRVREWVRIA